MGVKNTKNLVIIIILKKTKILRRHPAICFIDKDLEGVDLNPPMVILVIVANFLINKVLVDQDSSTNLLYLSTLRGMSIFQAKTETI